MMNQTVGRALKSNAKTHANVDVHLLFAMTTSTGRETAFALCSSNLDGTVDRSLTAADVTCVKCLAKLAKRAAQEQA